MRILIVIVGLFLISCSAPTTQPVGQAQEVRPQLNSDQPKIKIKEALEEQVKGMEFLGDIHGFSGWYGVFATKGFKNAKEDALKQAIEMGATHVVFEKHIPQYGGTEVHGKAYREKR